MLAVIAGGYVYASYARQQADVKERNEQASGRVNNFEKNQTAATQIGDLPFNDNSVIAENQVLAINRVPGEDYGKLIVRKADGSRKLFERECVRVHAANGTGICMYENGITSFRADLFELSTEKLTTTDSWASFLPSRARVSPSGQRASATAFASGASYQDVGQFHSIVEMVDVNRATLRPKLDGFTITSATEKPAAQPTDGELELTSSYWGTTFIDDDEFYVTYANSSGPEIMKGSTSKKSIEATGWKGSCPSLSPDGKTLVIKEQFGDSYQLVAIDIDTGNKTELGEASNVDDQVDWFDNDTILYGRHTHEEPAAVQPEYDIWSLDITPGSKPELFLPNADSPATYRSG